MSFLVVVPEFLTSAAADVENIGFHTARGECRGCRLDHRACGRWR